MVLSPFVAVLGLALVLTHVAMWPVSNSVSVVAAIPWWQLLQIPNWSEMTMQFTILEFNGLHPLLFCFFRHPLSKSLEKI